MGLRIAEFEIRSPKEHMLMSMEVSRECGLITYLNIFKGLALTETFDRCLESILCELTPEQVELLKDIYTDQRNLALAELNVSTFLNGKDTERFRKQFKSANPLPHINLAGKTPQERTDAVYEAFSEGSISLEDALNFMRLIQFEAMALKDTQVIIPVSLD